MRFGLQTWGSQGDVEPFLALAGALAERGHDVRLVVTTQSDRDVHEPPGVSVERVGSSMNQAQGDELFDRIIALKSPMEQGRLVLQEGLLPSADAMYAAARDLATGCDVVVRHHFLYMTRTAATQAETPEVSVFLTPDLLPTRAHPPTGMPGFGPLQPVAWWLADKGISRIFGPPAAELRTRVGKPPPKGVLRDVWPSDTANLVAVSPALFDRPDDWSGTTHLTGFWKAPAASEFAFPAELRAFLDAGRPPVFATFGSISGGTGERRADDARLLVEAARVAGQRLVLQQPVGEPPDIEGDDVLTLHRAPHALAFAECAAVVHHGGAGTTQTAIRAGAPSVVVPHLADQFFWAEQVKALGVGTATRARSKVKVRGLAAAISRACADEDARRTCAAIGAKLESEAGTDNAVAVLESIGRAQA